MATGQFEFWLLLCGRQKQTTTEARADRHGLAAAAVTTSHIGNRIRTHARQADHLVAELATAKENLAKLFSRWEELEAIKARGEKL